MDLRNFLKPGKGSLQVWIWLYLNVFIRVDNGTSHPIPTPSSLFKIIHILIRDKAKPKLIPGLKKKFQTRLVKIQTHLIKGRTSLVLKITRPIIIPSAHPQFIFQLLYIYKIFYPTSWQVWVWLYPTMPIRDDNGTSSRRITPIPTSSSLFKITLIPIPFKKLNGAGRVSEFLIPIWFNFFFIIIFKNFNYIKINIFYK